MSQLQVNRINDASGGVLAPISSVHRNRIINGDCRIDQRNAGASVTVTNAGLFTVDRFNANKDTSGATVTAQQSSTAPAGFVNSLLWTTSTGSSPASGDDNFIAQKIEGFNITDLGWGTANAKTVTLSFWVRSSLTGTFGVSFRNSGGSRSYVASYTISSANTFEYKTVTITGDTSGTWLTTNGLGIWIDWDLGCGTSRSTTAGSWQAGSFPGLTSGVKLVQTTGATFYITGVQLEVGTQATSFEYRQYGQELALCQRYYWKNAPLTAATNSGLGNGFQTSTTASSITVFYPVTMRALPTATQSNLIISDNASHDSDVSSIGAIVSTLSSSYVGINHASGGATYRPCNLRSKASGGIGFIDFSSEL